MKITVILCTYNRCRKLGKALESLAASILPRSVAWEVLVVDNNSTDRTREVVEDFANRFPDKFRYLFEPRQGKSRALNAGIREARGDLLAFVDDDVIVAPTWLQNLTAPLDGGVWAGVGGRVLLQETIAEPSWLPLNGPFSLAGMLTVFDLGDDGFCLDVPPFGTNMAFPRPVFEKYGDFRTDMGPCPGSEIRNEDTEFGRRLLLAGERLWYAPSAIVYHEVPEERLKKGYFLRFWYDHGRAAVIERGHRPDILGIPRYYLTLSKLLAITLPAQAIRWCITFDPKQRFYFKGNVWSTIGQFVELSRQCTEWKKRASKTVTSE
jgi:glycosyltransferase involved in cell wall biosynthesis